MRARALSLLVLPLLLVLAVPSVSNAQIFNQVRTTGVITSIQSWQETFVLQELGQFGQGRVWNVRVSADTVIRRNSRTQAQGGQAVFSLLRVGDVLDLDGFLVGANQLFARSIDVRTTVAGNGRGRDDDDDDDDDRGRRGREIRLTGVITAVETRGQGILHLQTQSSVRGLSNWTVRLYPRTEVEGLRQAGRGRQTKGRGNRFAFQHLRVGDFIEVEGRLLGNRQILAEEIRLRGQAAVSPFPVPFPSPVPSPGPAPSPSPIPSPFPIPSPVPTPGQIVIHSPRQGAEIATSEFSVVGQTIPGTQVRVEVTARFGVIGAPLPVTSGTVTADQNGFFTFVVRPPARVPGTVYTIRVSSATQGVNAPPVSVTVRQL